MENITLGNMLGALLFVVSFIGAIEFLALRTRRYIKNIMKDEIEPLKEELRHNSLNTMKNTICNENIPITERLIVGKDYIEKGGNGAVKIYLHKLEEEFEKQLKQQDLTKSK